MKGQKGIRILCFDGGGTRGVLTLALLKHVEKVGLDGTGRGLTGCDGIGWDAWWDGMETCVTGLLCLWYGVLVVEVVMLIHWG